jgi:hypothetical protein
MKVIFIIAALAALVNLGGTARADLIETYTARLSSRDHRSSTGTKLTDPAAIIRQDRANFHKFGKRDSEDQYDSFFSKASNRDKLEKLLKNGSISPTARKSVLNGTPLIRVKIYDDHVEVFVSSGSGIWD